MNSARRVLHLITTLDRGGAEKALLVLCAAHARERRFVPSVMWIKGRGELAGEFEGAGVSARRLARREIARFDPHVIHTHLFKADVAGAALAGRKSRRRLALVSTKHNEDRYLAGATLRAATWRTLARRAARRADAVVAISRGVAAFFRAQLGDAVGAMSVVPYGVPPARRVATREAAAFRARHGAAGKPLVLQVGRLDPQKDPAAAIRATSRAGAHLVFLGRGPMEEELRALAEATPGASVAFAGFVEDPAPAYEAADAVLLASRWEGLGLALVEAMQHGRAVVATRVGGIPEVVEDGVTGVLAPAGDADALATALARVLGDDAFRARLGAAGRRAAEQRFSVERYAREVGSVYDGVLQVRSRGVRA